MATPILFAFSLLLLLRSVLTVPLGVKSVQLSDSAPVSELTSRPEPGQVSRQVRSLSSVTLPEAFPSLIGSKVSVTAEHVKRTKREIVVGPTKCSRDMIYYGGRCWTPEKYELLMEDYDEKR